MKKQQLSFDEAYEEAINVDKLIKKGYQLDEIERMLNMKLFELSYNNGALRMKQFIMVDNDDIFYGRDAIDRLVVGAFIDKRFIAFCILENDRKIAKYIGYNCGDYFTIKLDDTDVCTGLDIRAIKDKSLEIQYLYKYVMAKLEGIEEIIQEYMKEIDELKDNISGYPYILYKLNPSDEVPEMK